MPWTRTAVGGCGPEGDSTDHSTSAPLTISYFNGAEEEEEEEEEVVEEDDGGPSVDTAAAREEERRR